MEDVLISRKLSQKKKDLVLLWNQVVNQVCRQEAIQVQSTKINLLWFLHTVLSQNTISSKEEAMVEVAIMVDVEILQRIAGTTWIDQEVIGSMMSVSISNSKGTVATVIVEVKVVWEETTIGDIGKVQAHLMSLDKIQAHITNSISKDAEMVEGVMEAQIIVDIAMIEATTNNHLTGRIGDLSVIGVGVEIELAKN